MITCEGLSKEDKETLRGILEGFLHGECYAFALAIHKAAGWPLCALMNGEVIQHVGVRDLKGRFFDARGFVEESDIITPFRGEFQGSCEFKTVTPEELHATRSILPENIARARKYAELSWPELPWPDTERQFMMSFLEAFETLCRERGFWIHCSSPICISRSFGDEAGYRLQMSLVGGSHFDRVTE